MKKETKLEKQFFAIKYFMKLFIPLTAIIIMGTSFIYNTEIEKEIGLVENQNVKSIGLIKRIITKEMEAVKKDLLIASKSQFLQKYFLTNDEDYLKMFTNEMFIQLETKKSFDQIRYIDNKGMELSRINFNKDNPIIVEKNRLQDKSYRYYFKEVIKRDKNEFFISPLDLNVENGEVEKPFKPMIRVGTPVFDEKGNKKGIIIFNYFGNNFLDLFSINEDVKSLGFISIINRDGFWLKAQDPSDEWGFMFEDRKNRKFDLLFPNFWKEINSSISGQFNKDRIIYTYNTFYPNFNTDKSNEKVIQEDNYWKIVSTINYAELGIYHNLPNYIIFNSIIIFAVFIMTLFLVSIKRKTFNSDIEHLKQSDIFENILKSSIDRSIIITDLNCNITYINPLAQELFGYKAKMIIGKDIDNIFNVFDSIPKNFKKNICDVKSSGEYRFNFDYIGDDNITRFIKVRVADIVDKKKELLGYSFFIKDITEEKQLNEQLLQSQKMEVVGTMVGGIAHDFNNILTVINGYADLSLMSMKEKDRYYNDMTQIKKAGHRAGNITRQLLSFSRKQKVETKILDLNAIIKNLEKMLKRLVGENILLNINLSKNLKTIKADESQIEQILMNLVVNARDAVSSLSLERRIKEITIETEEKIIDESFVINHSGSSEGIYVLFSVIDNGTGISEEVTKNIFNPFFTTKEKGKGTGLGLSIVYDIIKQNKGYISVDSKLGEWTRFDVYWPTSKESLSFAESTEIEATEIVGKEKILIVEDDLAICDFTARGLEALGYEVYKETSVLSALKLLKSESYNFDLIISDVVMPEMNGKEFIERVHEKKSKMKAVFISGYTDDILKESNFQIDDTEFVQKPFTIKKLADKVREVLDEKDNEYDEIFKKQTIVDSFGF